VKEVIGTTGFGDGAHKIIHFEENIFSKELRSTVLCQ
jgi:hypothetical protein